MAENVAKPVAPPSSALSPATGQSTPGSSWTNFSFSNLPIGLAVFFLASLAVIFLCLLINLPFAGDYFETKAVRSIQLVLAVAGLGLIANFLTSSQGAMSIAFGLLVVAALIIPSKDIVRFALIVSGSDRRVDDFYGVAVSGVNAVGRSTDAAQNVWSKACKILNDANSEPEAIAVSPTSVDGGAIAAEDPVVVVEESLPTTSVCDQIDEGVREDIITEIANAIEAERRKTMIERIKARGAAELLQAVGESDTIEDFIIRHEGNERLAEDLRFLRQEDLISIAYDNLNTASLTPFGRQVLSELIDAGRVSSGRVSSVRSNSPTEDVVVFDASLALDACPAELASVATVSFFELASGKRVRVDDSEMVFWQLSVSKEEAGTYEFRTERLSRDTDPTLAISAKLDGLTQEAIAGCSTYSRNDDGQLSGLDSFMSVNLSEGSYILAIGSLRGVGEVRVFSKRVSSPSASTGDP